MIQRGLLIPREQKPSKQSTKATITEKRAIINGSALGWVLVCLGSVIHDTYLYNVLSLQLLQNMRMIGNLTFSDQEKKPHLKFASNFSTVPHVQHAV